MQVKINGIVVISSNERMELVRSLKAEIDKLIEGGFSTTENLLNQTFEFADIAKLNALVKKAASSGEVIYMEPIPPRKGDVLRIEIA